MLFACFIDHRTEYRKKGGQRLGLIQNQRLFEVLQRPGALRAAENRPETLAAVVVAAKSLQLITLSKSRPKSSMMTWVALRPGPPVTPPPGWVLPAVM
jgi:hypothetical protein